MLSVLLGHTGCSVILSTWIAMLFYRNPFTGFPVGYSRTMSLMKHMLAFKTPPEVLLRQAARKDAMKNQCVQLSSTAARMSTYRAAVCTELDQPVQVQDVPRQSTLSKGQVRVAVGSCSIQFADLLMLKGKYQEKPPLPFTPGSEFTGRVIEVSPEVKQLKVGDKVIAISSSLGGFAEETVVSAKECMPLPDHVDASKAAALLVSYGTAYMALKNRANIKEGETVLVTAAAGATGLAAIDLATNVFKAKVIGACGGPEKCALVRSRGAMAAIDYHKEDVAAVLKELTGGRGVDIVFDNVGGKMAIDCVKRLAFEGRFLAVGFASGEIPQIPANLLLVKSCSAVGLFWGSYGKHKPADFIESISTTLRFFMEGKINPHVSAAYPLDKINDAFDFIKSRSSTGKVIINVNDL